MTSVIDKRVSNDYWLVASCAIPNMFANQPTRTNIGKNRRNVQNSCYVFVFPCHRPDFLMKLWLAQLRKLSIWSNLRLPPMKTLTPAGNPMPQCGPFNGPTNCFMRRSQNGISSDNATDQSNNLLLQKSLALLLKTDVRLIQIWKIYSLQLEASALASQSGHLFWIQMVHSTGPLWDLADSLMALWHSNKRSNLKRSQTRHLVRSTWNCCNTEARHKAGTLARRW